MVLTHRQIIDLIPLKMAGRVITTLLGGIDNLQAHMAPHFTPSYDQPAQSVMCFPHFIGSEQEVSPR